MTNSIKKSINKKLIVNCSIALILFVICFTLFSLLRGNVWFMDEMDNFANGVQMAKGSMLYRDIFSQHMPLMYYINMAMSLLGVSSVLGFRLAWYALLSFLYIVLFFRYGDKFGKITLFFWPIIYIFGISQVDLASSILAEQLQAIGMVILLLEFILFIKTNKLSKTSAAFIAIGINISFLSAFVSAFACAVIVMGFVVKEVCFCLKSKFKFAQSVTYLWKKYALTIIFTLAPMVLLALYYVITSTFDDFFYRAIIFNMEVYSDYQGGFGESPIGAVFGAIKLYIDFIKQNIQTLFQGANILSGGVIFLNAMFLIYMLALLVKRKLYTFFVIGAFFIMCGSRGFFNFHALQCFALCAVMLAMFAQGFFDKIVQVNQKKIIKLACGSFAVILLSTYFVIAGDVLWQRRNNIIVSPNEFVIEYDAHSYETLVNTLTKPDEYILQNVNMEHIFLSTHAKMAPYHTGMSPWWWIATSEASMQFLNENPPNVAIYSSNYASMGYVVKDFAPELDEFVMRNYTLLYEDAPYLYVHNDFYEQALSMLPENDEDMIGTIFANTTCGTALENGEISQTFTANRDELKTLSIQFGTHSRIYTGEINVKLTKDKTGEILSQYTIDGKDVKDNNFTFIHREDDESIPLDIGENYTVTIDLGDSDDKNLTIWAHDNSTQYTDENGQAGDEKTAENSQDMLINAVTSEGEQNYTLRIKVR